jgi:hypothetical protein
MTTRLQKRFRKLAKTWRSAAATIAAAAAVAAVTISAGVAGTAAAASSQAAAEPETSRSVVEDFTYPGAAQILAEKNVKLTTGDGHIVLAVCGTPPVGDIGLIEVYTSDPSTNDGGEVCFKVLGATGLLNMQVPAVFEIRGDGRRTGTGHDITAVVQTEGEQPKTIEVDSDGSTQVGEGTFPAGPPATLLQLRVTG